MSVKVIAVNTFYLHSPIAIHVFETRGETFRCWPKQCRSS